MKTNVKLLIVYYLDYPCMCKYMEVKMSHQRNSTPWGLTWGIEVKIHTVLMATEGERKSPALYHGSFTSREKKGLHRMLSTRQGGLFNWWGEAGRTSLLFCQEPSNIQPALIHFTA
jgi:hypothetical protein